jgi:hypothetical protein
MEEIQFLNYILSICAFLMAAWALWNTFKTDEKNEWQIKEIRDNIRLVKESIDAKRK